MRFRLPDIQLMPYAVDTWSPESLRVDRQARGGLELTAEFPCEALVLGSSRALTLNNTRFDLDGMPDLTDSGGSEALFLRDLVRRQCRPWDAGAQRFVDRYFATLETLLAEHAGEIAERLSPFHGLYEASHFVFSAPRPFPRAHLFAPPAASTATFAPEDFVAVDFAFWLGPGLVAMLSAQSGLTPRKARERLERLERAGIAVFTYSNADLAEGARDFFCRALAPRLPRFWQHDPVPVGPFRPAGIED